MIAAESVSAAPLAALLLAKALPREGAGGPPAILHARIEGEGAAAVHAALADYPAGTALVAAVLDQSPFLAQIVRRHPAWLSDALAAEPHGHLNGLVASFQIAAREADEADFMRLVRQFRTRCALLIGLCECGSVWPVEISTAAISLVADIAVEAATAHLLRQFGAMGRLTIDDPGQPGPGSGLVVLALGKMGARELNYSSDIDVVLFYDPARAGEEHARIFTRLAHGLVKLLQERTADGYAFRVDLRLRPDPGSTPPAVSLAAAYTYYETLGQNWERAAFIKARPVAGDIALGERFLDDLKPFIWRKYFDFAAIADIHAMKRQIHAVRGHGAIAVAGHDIKLGRGGIREIEFFVQTQQLVFGGRRTALRGSRTLDMLAGLESEGWITAMARDELSDAYRFLRLVEHRLQMVADEQTQRLPADPAELEHFARFCGFADAKAFGAELTRQARIVQGHYALLFEDAPTLASEIGSLVFTGSEDDPDTLATITRLGFRDPARVTETVRGWHFGRRSAVTSARAREVLTEMTPPLLQSLGKSPDPDAALAALDRAFAKMPAATELLTLLGSREGLRDLFADILGSAPRLAEIVGATPHVLDAVIDPAFTAGDVSEAAIEARMRAMLGEPAGMEAFLDRIREIARHENFLVGARLLSGVVSPERAGIGFSAVAASAVRMTLAAVRAAFEAEHGVVQGARAVVVGLGRLGLHEMTASSDIDLMVVYDGEEDGSAMSDGRKPLDVVTYHIRLTQRLIGALTAPTRRGILYEVDLRLRPSGRKGPLATKLASLTGYYEGEAETWERLALTKARVVAGDEVLALRVTQEIDRLLAMPRDAAQTRRDVAEMRQLLAQEKGESDGWDMKMAAGALTDIDFLAGALVLTHPQLVATRLGGPQQTLRQAGDEGVLAPGDAASLVQARRQLGDVLQWQRLLVRERFDPQALPQSTGLRLAAAMGCPDLAMLRAGLDETRAGVRAVYEAFFG